MRVLWFTNIPMEAVNERFGRRTGGNGFWMHALIKPLSTLPGVKLAVVTADGDPQYHFEHEGVEYFNIHQNKAIEVFGLFRGTRLKRYLQQAADIVNAWKPDLIHVHGTERFFGLVRSRGLVNTPTVVSIQHILAQIYRYSWGEMTLGQVIGNTTIWQLLHNATVYADGERYGRQIPHERSILNGVQGALGRTAWDHAHVRRLNPNLPYFHVDEIMRPQFGDSEPWSLANVRLHSLITTSSAGPVKGLWVLIRAAAILRDWGYDVHLKIAGMAPGDNRRAPERWIHKLIRELNMHDRIELLGWSNAENLIAHQLTSHCFVTPSYSENGCNALSEAQLVGIPCVASHAGGLTTTITDEKTGLLFSPGDEAMLARQVERIFLDDSLAASLGGVARLHARARHDPQVIVDRLMQAYSVTAGSRT